jgi:hypothetical protein
LNILKELDFDNSVGKIPAENYSTQRANLVQQGAEILRKIDQLAPVAKPVPTVTARPVTARNEEQVEAILSARRASQSAGVVTSENEVESLLASRRKVRTGKSGIFCSQCGKPLVPSDRFCPACGHPVS